MLARLLRRSRRRPRARARTAPTRARGRTSTRAASTRGSRCTPTTPSRCSHGKNDLGQGLETTFRQIVAEEMDLTFKQVKSVVCDTAQHARPGRRVGLDRRHRRRPAVRNMAAEARARARRARREEARRAGRRSSRSSTASSPERASAKMTYGELLGGTALQHDRPEQHVVRERPDRRRRGEAEEPGRPPHRRLVGAADRHPGQGVRQVQLQRRREACPGWCTPASIRPRDAGSTLVKINGFKKKVAGPRPRAADGQALRRGRRRARGAGDRGRAGARRARGRSRATPPFSTRRGSSTGSARRSRGTARRATNTGNVDTAIAGAAKKIEAEYLWPLQSHAGMAPGNGARELRQEDQHDHGLERDAEVAPGPERRRRPARDAEGPGPRDLADGPGLVRPRRRRRRDARGGVDLEADRPAGAAAVDAPRGHRAGTRRAPRRSSGMRGGLDATGQGRPRSTTTGRASRARRSGRAASRPATRWSA